MMGLRGWERGSSQYLTWKLNVEDNWIAMNHDLEVVGWMTEKGLWVQEEEFGMSPGCLEQVRLKQKEHGFEFKGLRFLGFTWHKKDNIHNLHLDEHIVGHLSLERVGKHIHWCWYQDKEFKAERGVVEIVRQKQKEIYHNRKKEEDDGKDKR